MKLHEIYKFETKSGKPISFNIVNEVSKTKPWVFTKIRAYVSNEYVGYLIIGNISRESFYEYIPTIWHYAFLISGYSMGQNKQNFFKNLPDKEEKFTKEQKIELVRRCNGYWNFVFGDPVEKKGYWNFVFGDPVEKKVNFETIKKIWPEAMKIIRRHKGESYDNLKSSIDKPYIDFIRVNHGESDFDKRDDLLNHTTATDWRRNRIAIALYIFAAEWLHKKGMKLYASSLQSDDAIEAWKKLNDLGFVGFSDTKRFVKI